MNTYGVDVAAALGALEAHHDLLPKHQVEFAKSLLVQSAGSKLLSDKQLWWVKELAKKAAGIFMNPPKPEPSVNVGALQGVYKLFDLAAQSLKKPSIRLSTPAGQKVVLKLQNYGPNAGTIGVSDGVYGGMWFGRIQPNGTWTPGKALAASPTSLGVVYSLLVSFAEDPAGVGAAQGKLAGHCVFCSQSLTDPKSLEVGYGPVCAKKWGLPWGAK